MIVLSRRLPTVAVKNDIDLGVASEDLAKAMEANQPIGKRINIVR